MKFFTTKLLKQWCFSLLLLLLSTTCVFAQGSPNVTLLDNVDDYATYNDCWGYSANGREYALLGTTIGLSIIDITTAGSAQEVAFISGPTSSWRDIKTYQNYAYVVNETGGGMHIIDLSNLPASATLVNTYNGFTTSHNIYIETDRGILYAEGNSSQPVRTLDLSDPENPVQISFFGTECHDIYARDGMVYVSEGTKGSIGIYDLTTAASPSLVARIPLPNPGYVHNAWLSEDGRYLMTTEENAGKVVRYIDIADPNNPVFMDTYLGSNNLAHNTHIMGNYAYISHYTGGLRIVDLSDPSDIFEAGYYDTHPSNSSSFNGAWGAYPFFDSGKILISDIQTGLYVVTFSGTLPPPGLEITLTPIGGPIVIPPSGGSFDYTLRIENTGASPISFEVWNLFTLPSGNSYGPTIGPTGATFGPGQVFTKTVTQTVPGNIPLGSYTLAFHAGSAYPNADLASDDFTFTVSASPSSGKTSSTNFVSEWVMLDYQSGLAFTDESFAAALEGDDLAEFIPDAFVLQQNYPNPFNPSTVIQYSLDRATHVKIQVFNLLGAEVRTLVDRQQYIGHHSVVWNGKDHRGQAVPAGAYIYRIEADGVSQVKKMILTK